MPPADVAPGACASTDDVGFGDGIDVRFCDGAGMSADCGDGWLAGGTIIGCARSTAGVAVDGLTPAGTVCERPSFGVTIGAIVGLALTGAVVGVPRVFDVVSPRLKNAVSAAVAWQ